jgi:oxalate decarboxylase/phosphoglucose isomerase-like protein (cupin superfamily)
MGENYVVRHAKDVVNFRVDNCGGGEGSIYVRQILGYDPTLPVPGFPGESEAFHFVHLTTIPKGSSVGKHYHKGNEEFYLVIKGKGEMIINDGTYIVETGSIGLVKDGAAHGMKNIGDDDLVMVVVEAEIKKTERDQDES